MTGPYLSQRLPPRGLSWETGPGCGSPPTEGLMMDQEQKNEAAMTAWERGCDNERDVVREFLRQYAEVLEAGNEARAAHYFRQAILDVEFQLHWRVMQGVPPTVELLP